MRTTTFITLATLIASAACGDYSSTGPYTQPGPTATVTNATGDVSAAVIAFRTLLGNPNGATAGEQADGRREITWDGAAANPLDNRNDFPGNFFNTTAKNGAVFTTPGTGFRNDSTAFAEINPTYAAQFGTFSPNKIFSPIGSNVLDVAFQVAGEQTAAVVRGFGIVFSDVDVANRTTVELFAQDGSSLGVATAPVRSDEHGLSFVGVSYEQAIIAKVRITLGTAALGATVNDITSGGTADVVVLDNLIYGEPHRIP